MSKTKGVVVARIHVLNQLQLNGHLDPAIATILDELEPGWRTDLAAKRWTDTAAAAADWTRATGFSPEINDDGAEGLRPWLDAQDLDALPKDRRQILEALPGWRSTIDDPEAGAAWRVVTALVNQGIQPSQAHNRESVTWLAGEYRRLHPRRTLPGLSVTGSSAVALLDFALFCARYGRPPARGDNGHRWTVNAAREAISSASVDVRALHDPVEQSGPSTAWFVSANRVRVWLRASKRRPRATGQTREERYCSGWLKRQRARAAAGALSPIALQHLSQLDGVR